jgi:DNA-binding response OmpR family regulator
MADYTQNKKALIIDDDESFRSVLTAMLQKLNFDVLFAERGDKGIQIANAEDDIDLVVLDLFLPDVRGDKVCPELRKKHPRVNIIVMSGYGIEDTKKFLDENVQDFLQKPCSFDDFSSSIKSLFG